MTIAAVGLTTGDFAWGLSDLPAALDRFAGFGVDTAELSLSAFDVVVNGRVLPHRLKALKAAVAGAGLGVTVHGPISSTFTDGEHRQIHLDVCRACLDVAAEIGAPVVVWHQGGVDTGSWTRVADALAAERDALAEIGPHAAARGVTLAVENIFGRADRWHASPAELAQQLAMVDHPNIRATIDFSHGAINAGVRGFDFMESVRALAPYAAHLHVHDSAGKPQTFVPFTTGDAVAYGVGDLHLPPGWTGALDWEALAALPYPAETRIVANLELASRFRDELPAAIALCRRMIQIASGADEIIAC